MNGNANTIWNNGRGLTLPGGNGGSAPAVRLPDSLLSGLNDVTIAYDIRLSSTTQQGPVFAFGRTAGQRRLPHRHAGRRHHAHQASIAGPGASPVAQTVGGPVALAANTWKHVAVTIKGGDAVTPGRMLLYEDGALVDSNTALTLKPADITSVDRLHRSLGHRGRTAVPGQDQGLPRLLQGADRERGAGPVERVGSGQPGRAEGLGRSRRHHRGDKDIALPALSGVTWGTSDATVVTAQGVVTRPAAGQGDAHATLTAAFAHRGLTDTKPFPITVKQRVTIPPDQLAAGLVHFYKLDETSGTTLADSGTAGAAGNATLVNPDKAAMTGAGVTLNPDAYADSLTGAHVDLPGQHHGGHDRAERRLRHQDRPGQRGRPPSVELRTQDELRGDANGSYGGSIFGSNTGRPCTWWCSPCPDGARGDRRPARTGYPAVTGPLRLANTR